MNFNVYLDDESVRRLDALARRERVARNALIRRAVLSLLDRSGNTWPLEVLHFEGDPSFTAFEAHRDELAAPADDPFAQSVSQPRGARRTERTAAPKRSPRPRRA